MDENAGVVGVGNPSTGGKGGMGGKWNFQLKIAGTGINRENYAILHK